MSPTLTYSVSRTGLTRSVQQYIIHIIFDRNGDIMTRPDIINQKTLMLLHLLEQKYFNWRYIILNYASTFVNLPNVADEFQCDFPFPVAVCVENDFLLDKTQCGFPFPVQVCAENDFLLDSAQCDFEFPEETCTANPKLFER